MPKTVIVRPSRVETCISRSGTISNVARRGGGGGGGGYSFPIRLKSMQSSTFLVLLRPIFAPKLKTAPLKGIGRAEVAKYLQQSGVFFFWSSLVTTFFFLFLEIT